MKTKIIILFATIMMLSSCLSTAYLRLLEIRMGMSTDQVFAILNDENNSSCDVHFINGVEDLYDISDKVNTQSKIEILIAKKYFIEQTGGDEPFYIFAFEDNKLIYWGYPLEFTRKDDPKVNQIGDFSLELIEDHF